MKPISFFLSLTLMCVLLSGSSCRSGNESTSSKNYILRNYKVADFSALDISTVGDVYFTQSTDGKSSLEIYGPENVIERIDVSIKNNTLYLTMEKKFRIKNIKKMKINITAPELNGIVFNGVGDVNITDGVTTNVLTVGQHGVGDVKITALDCKEVKVTATGVGDMRMAGVTERATFNSRGVGNINAIDLECKTVNAHSTGVGNVSCFASESITASVDGVGNITYKGSPQERRINKNGIGSIKAQ